MKRKYQYQYVHSRKSRLIALALCICGGCLGLHYFYVGRYWRAALNLLLSLALTIASNVFGIYYFQIYFGNSGFFFVHWREIVAVASASILGLLLIWDVVRIAQGKFKDAKHYYLR